MRFPFSEFVATYRVTKAVHLPDHSGSLLRGVLGRALRRAACLAASPCTSTCEGSSACSYTRLFDPPVPNPRPHKLLRGATRAPQPLLPLIPTPGARVLAVAVGDSFAFAVRVLGEIAPEEEQRLRRTLELITDAELGRERGRLEVISVTQRGEPNRLPSIPRFDPPPRRATVTFETPAWIEHRGKLSTSPDFRTLFRNFYRRLTIVSALYGEYSDDDDARFSRLDAACEKISIRAELSAVSWERHSLEGDTRHPMKGMLGRVELEGELGPFVEILRLAEFAHVGKATSHGLGRVRVAFF